MAELAIPIAMSVGGSLLTARAQKQAGADALAAGELENAQSIQAGYQAAGAGQRKAIEQRRQATLANSTAVAQGAAGGGMGISDIRNQGQIAQQGEYNALTELYNGNEQKRALDNQGQAALTQGYQAKNAANKQAFSTLLQGGASLFSKYGFGAGGGGGGGGFGTNPGTTSVQAPNTDAVFYPNSGTWIDWDKSGASYG